MNNSLSTTFTKPRLRDGVTVQFNIDSLELNYRQQGAFIDIPADLHQETDSLFNSLQLGGHTYAQLLTNYPALSNHLEVLLQDLDKLGLLTETADLQNPQGRTGLGLWCELQRFVKSVEAKTVPSGLYRSLQAGMTSARQLQGYALEYYHLVHLSPRFMAPIIADFESAQTHSILLDFFVSELHHDQMIAKALYSVGIDQRELDTMIPLPMTYAICSALSSYATQHPLSFKAALFLLERPQPEFHTAFQQRCEELHFPQAFIDPILEHSGINEEGNHEDISLKLLSEVAYVSPEEEQVVKKNMVSLIECLVGLEHQILEYYGDESAPLPRCFD